MKIGVGLIFFDDLKSLQRCIPTLDVDTIYAIDGRFKGYKTSNALSTDGSREYLQSFTNVVLIDAPDLEQFEKRNMYLKACNEEFLFVVDSDHLMEGDWKLFKKELDDKVNLKNGYGYSFKIIDKKRGTEHYQILGFYKPNLVRYRYMHDWYEVDGERILPYSYGGNNTILQTLKVYNDDSFRPKNRQTMGNFWRVKNRKKETSLLSLKEIKGKNSFSTSHIDTTIDSSKYVEFYNRLGKEYPESNLIHRDRDSTNSLYAIITTLLKPYAKKGMKLLDVGCNDGIFAIPFCQDGGEVTGIDISSNVVERAKKKTKDLKAEFSVADIQKPINFSSNSFDIILLANVFELLSEREIALSNVVRVLKPGGILILTAPTPAYELEPIWSLKRIIDAFFSKKPIQQKIIDSDKNPLSEFGLSGYLYRHDAFYPRGLRILLKNQGFNILNHFTIHFGLRPILDMILSKIPVIKMLGKNNVIVAQKKILKMNSEFDKDKVK